MKACAIYFDSFHMVSVAQLRMCRMIGRYNASYGNICRGRPQVFW